MEYHTVDRKKNEKNENVLEAVQEQPCETDLQLHGVKVASLDEKMTCSEKLEVDPQREVLVIRDFPLNALPLLEEEPALNKNESLDGEESGEEEADDRYKINETLLFFRMVYGKLLLEQSEEIETRESIDSQVVNILKSKGKYINTDKQIIGAVPGIEVGDRFQHRLELSLVGIHSPAQSGIGYLKTGEDIFVTSMLAFGGYTRDLHNTEFIFYKTEGEDKAFLNCYYATSMIRVIRFVKGCTSRGEGYVYDGLYTVRRWNREEGPEGKEVYTYELCRNADQPKLGSYFPTWTRLIKGVCNRDISQGREMIPLFAVNTRDGDVPPQFEYVSDMLYPDWFSPFPREGCDCTRGCSNFRKCSCVVLNGGEVPYNHDGTIVKPKPLVFECGPTCRCPPFCKNRVSQHGIKFRLEIFKHRCGWGVRSPRAIPKGSFVCEYAGEIKAEDTAFTIDATHKGNVGRFLKRSLFPNLFVQKVLYDHDNREIPHIMLFAKRDLPSMKELCIKFRIPRLVLDILMFKGLYSFKNEEDDDEDDEEDDEELKEFADF